MISTAFSSFLVRLRESNFTEIEPEEYDEKLDILPPKWMGAGFLFGEGDGACRYYWQTKGRAFYRQLTVEETEQFKLLAHSRRFTTGRE